MNPKKRESNSNNKGSHQIKRENNKRKETKMNYKEKPKSTYEISEHIYLLIITLNVGSSRHGTVVNKSN